ncbi:hypothetical protein HMPREF1002_01265 [Porphyromonas sp. 31_2]|nr:hypothetical protein HMPREF1002_01265 [Porphyromonas sp. 31_2]
MCFHRKIRGKHINKIYFFRIVRITPSFLYRLRREGVSLISFSQKIILTDWYNLFDNQFPIITVRRIFTSGKSVSCNFF